VYSRFIRRAVLRKGAILRSMAQRGVPAGWDSPADRPSILEITVESAPRRQLRVRSVHIAIAIALLGAIAGAIAIAGLPGGSPGSAPRPSTSPPAPQQPSVLVDSGPPSATAPGLYRFPVGCLYSRVTAVERNRKGPCAPHDGYVTAAVRRVGGVWRVTLEPIDRTCLPEPVPPLARGRVSACRR
jgi:hypothetical protein